MDKINSGGEVRGASKNRMRGQKSSWLCHMEFFIQHKRREKPKKMKDPNKKGNANSMITDTA